MPYTCSYEAIYLETGSLPIRFILQGRRLMFYWAILNKDTEELIKKVFDTQTQFPTKGDWTFQIEEDKKYLDIDISENSIKNMKKHKFKKLLKEKLKLKAAEYLYSCRDKEGRSKTKYLKSFGCQNYLKSNQLSTKEKKLLFSLRTQMDAVKKIESRQMYFRNS